jgi:hypothetical protein
MFSAGGAMSSGGGGGTVGSGCAADSADAVGDAIGIVSGCGATAIDRVFVSAADGCGARASASGSEGVTDASSIRAGEAFCGSADRR